MPNELLLLSVISPARNRPAPVGHQDMLPTLLAAAGEPDIGSKLKRGHTPDKKTYKVYVDGLNLLPYLKGELKESPRQEFLYWSDEGDHMAIRYGAWKVHFQVQGSEGMEARQKPFVPLRFPMLVNLRTDPFENAEIAGSIFYSKWRADRVFMLVPAGALVAQYLQTMMEFPPRQSPESWSPSAVMENLRRHQEMLVSGSGRRVK